MNQTKPTTSRHLLANDAPMTMLVIALKAEQARETILGGFDAAHQIRLRSFRTQMSVEDPSEILETPLARCDAARLGVPQAFQVKIIDALCAKLLSKSVFGKALLSRDRNIAHVDKQIDANVRQRRQEIFYRTTFIADGMQRRSRHITPILRLFYR